MRKNLILGLDGLDPRILTTLLDDLPAFSKLIRRGNFGPLKSCHPPITVPAWTAMSTGLTPGELGIYGFTNKIPGQYDTYIPDSTGVTAMRIWDYLGAQGKQSIIIGMPQTSPAQPLCGYMVGGRVIGQEAKLSTYPQYLSTEVDKLAGGHYVADTLSHRRGTPETIFQEALENTTSSFNLAQSLGREHEWDLLWLVIMAPDRVQHASLPQKMDFTNLSDSLVGKYYRFLDTQLGSFLEKMPPDCQILIVSDHGTTPCLGTFWLNRWLRQEGYLTLTEEGHIDWSKTMVWGQGGYYGRLYINVKGREAEGIVEPNLVPALKKEIAKKLQLLPTPWDNLPNTVLFPEKIYPSCQNQPPDLMLYAANLSARVIGLLDHGTTVWNEKPEQNGQLDMANHSQTGLFIIDNPKIELDNLYQIKSLILDETKNYPINYCP